METKSCLEGEQIVGFVGLNFSIHKFASTRLRLLPIAIPLICLWNKLLKFQIHDTQTNEFNKAVNQERYL